MDSIQRAELVRRSSVHLALALSNDSHLFDISDRRQTMRLLGHGHLVKAAVSPIASSDAGIDVMPFTSATVALVNAASTLAPLLAAGATSLPLNGTARLQATIIDAVAVAEGDQSRSRAWISMSRGRRAKPRRRWPSRAKPCGRSTSRRKRRWCRCS
jgi:hypothetical protein